MPDRRGSRFALEALFLGALAAALAFTALSAAEIVAVMLGGWALIALTEWAAGRSPAALRRRPAAALARPAFALPPAQPLERVAGGYPEPELDEGATWIASAALREELLSEWPLMLEPEDTQEAAPEEWIVALPTPGAGAGAGACGRGRARAGARRRGACRTDRPLPRRPVRRARARPLRAQTRPAVDPRPCEAGEEVSFHRVGVRFAAEAAAILAAAVDRRPRPASRLVGGRCGRLRRARPGDPDRVDDGRAGRAAADRRRSRCSRRLPSRRPSRRMSASSRSEPVAGRAGPRAGARAARRSREPEPEPEPEPAAPVSARVGGPPYNIGSLERALAVVGGQRRADVPAAVPPRLRRCRRDLPSEFDDLVRESFGALL